MILSTIRNSILTYMLLVGASCRTALPPRSDPAAAAEAWAKVPLAPRLNISEAITPQSVVVFVLDGHSGEPLDGATVTLTPANLAAVTDTSGRAAFVRVPSGRHHLLVRRLSNQFWSDSITVSDGSGLVLVVQLRRSAAIFDDRIPASRPP